MTKQRKSNKRMKSGRRSNFGETSRAGPEIMTSEGCPKNPVSLEANPWVTRWVRLYLNNPAPAEGVNADPSTGVQIYPQDVLNADSSNYGLSNPRFTRIVFKRGRCWGPTPDPTTKKTDMFVHVFNLMAGNAAPATSLAFQDQASADSADRPRVAWRWGSVDRGVIFQANIATGDYRVVTIPTEADPGHYIMDLQVSMC